MTIFGRLPSSAEKSPTKCSTSAGMSSLRRRSGGTSMGMTFSR